MKILHTGFPGSIHICRECGSCLAYTPADVISNYYIVCPVCREKQECKMNLSLDIEVSNDSTTNIQK